MTSIIILKSQTQAEKGRSYLSRMKIKCSITKITSKSGCVHGLKIWDNPQKICRLLALQNLECIKIVSGDDER